MGRVAGVFGIAGELKCDPSDAGRAVFWAGSELRCERRGESTLVRVAAARAHKGRLLLRLEGVGDAGAAQRYVGAVFYAGRERLPLDAGEFFDCDLVGCAVRDTSGIERGVVEAVEHYPASDMLVVGGHLIPMVGAIVRDVDLAKRRITIDPPAGLLD